MKRKPEHGDASAEDVRDVEAVLGALGGRPRRTAVMRARRGALDLADVLGPSKGSTVTYRAYVRGFIESGRPQTVEGFAEWIDSMRGRRPASSVNLALAAGRAALVQAAQRGGASVKELSIIKGALSEIPGERRAPPEVSTISPEERRLLLRALPPRVRLFAEVLYQTGARVSEIAGLRRDRVKVNGRVELRLYGKGRKERQGTVTPELWRRILAEYPEGEYVFTTSRGNPYRGTYITREIDRAARRVLGRSVTAHVLRHSRATDLLATTHRIKAVSRLLGHADEAVTLRYYVKDSFTDAELFAGVGEETAGEGVKA